MEPITYNGVKYRKRKNQNYYCSSPNRKKYSRYLHRQMWFDVHGKVPTGYHVHHLNHNSLDNRIENLGLIERHAHARLHSRKRVKENPEFFQRMQQAGILQAPKWHASPEGIEWHKRNAAKCNFGHHIYGEHKCESCGKEFIAKSWQSRFCSNNCKSQWRRNAGLDNIVKQCKTCGKDFQANKYQYAIVNCQSCRH